MRSLVLLAFLVLPTAVRAADADDLAKYDAAVKPADRKHWAFLPVKPRAVPALADAGWTRNPVDTVVRAKLEAQKWQPTPPAAKRALRRRCHPHLIGCAPTL